MTVSHFPLGSALLYKTNVGNQWALGLVLGSSRGLLEVGENLDSPHPILLPADSKDLLPVSYFSKGITVVSGKGDLIYSDYDFSVYVFDFDMITGLS